MIRLSILTLHSLLATLIISGGVLSWLQARVNITWEHGFYGDASELSSSLLLGAVAVVSFGVGHLCSAIAWFVGYVRAGWALSVVTLVLLAELPWPLGLVLAASTALVMLDMMVVQHREHTPPP